MAFTAKVVDGVEEKSTQELETEFLKQHEEAKQESNVTEDIVETKQQDSDINEDRVLSFIKEKYGKDITTVESLFEEKEVVLPEQVSAFNKFHKETGRGVNDFVKIQQDISTIPENKLLEDYYLSTDTDLDSEDIEGMITDLEIGEYDEDSEIKRKKIARKKEISKAKKYFEEQKEKYKVPLERSGASSYDDKEISELKELSIKAKTLQEEDAKRTNIFIKKTDEVFNSEFKGFEFDVDGNKILFAPSDAVQLKKTQSNVMNFVNKFLDDKGFISDAKGYHKALAAAMNPDGFAKFFYEKGLSDATSKIIESDKNINMSGRQTQQTYKGGFQVKPVPSNKGESGEFKVKSIK